MMVKKDGVNSNFYHELGTVPSAHIPGPFLPHEKLTVGATMMSFYKRGN